MIMVSIISKTHNLRYSNLENWNTVFGTISSHGGHGHQVAGQRGMSPKNGVSPKGAPPCDVVSPRSARWHVFADGMVFGPQEGDQIIIHSVSGGSLPSLLRAPQIIVLTWSILASVLVSEVGEVIQCRDSLFSCVVEDFEKHHPTNAYRFPNETPGLIRSAATSGQRSSLKRQFVVSAKTTYIDLHVPIVKRR